MSVELTDIFKGQKIADCYELTKKWANGNKGDYIFWKGGVVHWQTRNSKTGKITEIPQKFICRLKRKNFQNKKQLLNYLDKISNYRR